MWPITSDWPFTISVVFPKYFHLYTNTRNPLHGSSTAVLLLPIIYKLVLFCILRYFVSISCNPYLESVVVSASRSEFTGAFWWSELSRSMSVSSRAMFECVCSLFSCSLYASSYSTQWWKTISFARGSVNRAESSHPLPGTCIRKNQTKWPHSLSSVAQVAKSYKVNEAEVACCWNGQSHHRGPSAKLSHHIVLMLTSFCQHIIPCCCDNCPDVGAQLCILLVDMTSAKLVVRT